MAPAKRRRDESLHDDDDDFSHRTQSNGRAPVTEPDDAEEQDDAHRRVRNGTPPRTQYELLRDRNFEHLQHEELDDRAATQQVLGRPVRSGPNKPADNGIIESVTCCNFMCHTKLHVELGPLINFVVGENGSGKSAVLTALTLCLGAKASSTNRGSSLRAFIKEGQDQSMIQVQLKNQGPGAYQPDVFGESIIVQRLFSKTGTSGFRLKGTKSNKTISTKRQAIDEIVEHFCLQVDNPLNVLSQDNARQFLNSATPEQKYKYFVQGVQLETLDHDYKLVEEILENIEEKLHAYDGHLDKLKKEADKAHRLACIVREHETMRATLRVLRGRLIWSQVVEEEDKCAEIEEKVAAHEQKIEDLQSHLESQIASIQSYIDSIERSREQLESAKTDAANFDATVEAVEKEYRALLDDRRQLTLEERTVRGNWEQARSDVTAIKASIASEESRISATTGDARNLKQRELEKVKQSHSDAKQEIQELRQQRPDLVQELNAAKLDVQEARDNVERKRRQVHGVQGEISKLKQSNGNWLDAFPPNVKRLQDAIAKETRWQQKPIGPVGRLISLKLPEWSSILEKFLGQTPNAFIVTTKADMDRLRHLMDTCNVRSCPIIKTFPQRLDTTGKEPADHFDTILRVLSFDDARVRDLLIMNHSVEQVVLIKKRTEGEDIMFSDRKPNNISAILCFHDNPDKRGEGIMLQSRNSNHSSSPMDRFNGSPRMQSDAKSQLEERVQLLGQLQTDLRTVQEELQGKQTDLNNVTRRIEELDSTIDDKEDELRRIANKISDLELEIDQFDGTDVKLRALKERLRDAEESVEHNGTQYGQLHIKVDEASAKIQEMKPLVEQKQLERKDFDAKVRKYESRINSTNDALRLCQTTKLEIQGNVTRETEERDRFKRLLTAHKDQLAAKDAAARDLYPERVEVPEGETFPMIQAKFQSLRKRLQDVMSRLGDSPEVICQKEVETMDKYHKTKEVMDELVKMQKLMRKSLAERIERWRYFQRYLSARTRVNFSYLLSERGFRGKMIIDHRSKVLVLQVEPDEHRQSSKGRNTNTLSGGEKSFSSVCMLLSIWEAMGSSIRCLDEFDVFMDNVNRAISTNMLITAARRSVSRQYILITPNAIEGRAELDKDVKIIRLTDPRQRRITQMM